MCNSIDSTLRKCVTLVIRMAVAAIPILSILVFGEGVGIACEEPPSRPTTARSSSVTLLQTPFTPAAINVARAALSKSLGCTPEVVNSQGAKFVLIPPGEFLMGNERSVEELRRKYPYYQPAWFVDEDPQHRVRITKPFYMCTTEVTRGHFAAFVRDQNYCTEPERDGKGSVGVTNILGMKAQAAQFNWAEVGFPQTDAHPVVCVTVGDVNAFCKWLSKKEARNYRLPTEAEWEYACRAGTLTEFHHGSDPQGLAATDNIADRSAKGAVFGENAILKSDGFLFTAPVGKFKANAFGLYDMHGNVLEWCSDYYDQAGYPDSPVTIDPKGPKSGTVRSVRGGCWNYPAALCRSAHRCFLDESDSFAYLGFRLVVDPQGE